MMYFEKDLVNKAIALIDGKSKSDELKAWHMNLKVMIEVN